jgi:CubicO group peptidase (beta-lactamase class C family)/dienelactone hydrolase
MLLSHTSSLRDAGFYAVPLPNTLRDLFDPTGPYYAGGAHFAPVQPGAYFTYANLNFGVLATVMEAAAGERFDQYMQRHILAPLGIDGGYVLTELAPPGLAQLAALYTKQDANGTWNAAGPWYAQFDLLNGGRPLAPLTGPRLGPPGPSAAPSPAALLAAYQPGTNATIFAPYAGLRISARDLAKIVLLLLHEGRYAGQQIIAPATVQSMLREQWRYDPQRPNGDTGHGLLRAWGLGLQHTTASQDAAGGDRLAAGSVETFWGHRGEAYGFLGGVWFDPQRQVGFVFLIGGLGDNPLNLPGQYSSFNGWEEAIQTALLDEIVRWQGAQTQAAAPPPAGPRAPISQPVKFPTPAPTPDSYAGVTITDLASRSYGAGELRNEGMLAVTDAFTRTLIAYDSDGLTIYGFMNVPFGAGPFPVVLVNHGYIDPAVYRTLTYTTRYADDLARNGFIAIHPNLRGYGDSDDGPNEFRAGFAIDVLNLAALVRKLGGEPGPLVQADPQAIGLWGHSMGGGVSLKAITARPDLADAAVLYGAMSGDEERNHEQIYNILSGGTRGLYDPASPPSAAVLARLSPINYLPRIAMPVSIHHGDQDDQVPLWWSEELCTRLQELGKAVECFTYAGQPHTFVGDGDALFRRRVVDFLQRSLLSEP